MKIQKALHQRLASNATLMAAIQNRLYWVAPPFDAATPKTFVSYAKAGATPTFAEELNQPGQIQQCRIDVTVYSSTSMDAAADIAELIKETLQGFQVMWSTVTVHRAALVDEADVTDREVILLGYFAVTMSFEIHYLEA